MSDLAQGSFSSGFRCSSVRDSSPFRYPPPYYITTYLQNYRVYFDTVQFSMLPSVVAALVIPFGSGVRDTAAGLWRKCWKHWGLDTLYLQVAYREMDSPFVWCWEEKDYKNRLTTLLTETRHRSEVSSIVFADF